MKQQFFFFDVDGTLLDSVSHEFPPSAKQAICMLQQQGHKVFIATGRCYASLQRSGLMDEIEWDGYVLSNGQVVMLKDKRVIHKECIDHEAVKQCIVIAKQAGIALSMISDDTWFMMDEVNEYVHTAHQFLNEVLPIHQEYQGEPIITMLAYASLDADYNAFKAIKGVKVIPAQSTYADLIVEGVSKYDGIRTLCDYFHQETYCAFGDSLNDWEMMEHASLSIAMGQGNEQLKQNADFVTLPVNENGISHAIKVLRFNEEE